MFPKLFKPQRQKQKMKQFCLCFLHWAARQATTKKENETVKSPETPKNGNAPEWNICYSGAPPPGSSVRPQNVTIVTIG